MTADERAHLRTLIQQARRERAEREAIVEAEFLDTRLCGYCGGPIPVDRVGSGAWPARFCCNTHRKYAWRQTAEGKLHEQQAHLRRRERQRLATA